MFQLPQVAQDKIIELRQKFSDIPVPIIAIAQELGIKIYETNDFEAGQSGSIKKEGEDFVIYLKSLDPPARKRFTIAHELGHFIMHKDYLNSGAESITQTRQPILNRSSDTSTGVSQDKQMEIQANQFAAEILMPADEFKKVFEKANTIEEVAAAFHVSASAVTIRAKDLLGVFLT